MLAFAWEASVRVPRFSPLVVAESVRFVRFNMARPSLPPVSGGLETPKRRLGRRAGPPRLMVGSGGGGEGFDPSLSKTSGLLGSGGFPIPRVWPTGHAPGPELRMRTTRGPRPL